MVTQTRQREPSNPADFGRKLRKRFVQVIGVNVGLTAVLLFASAGTLNWPLAWVYVGATVAFLVINMLVLLRVNREVIAARADKARNQGRWHAVVSLIGGVFIWFGATIVSGLDYRFGWTPPYSGWFVGMALAVMAAGNFVLLWSMAVNKHFETGVRVQEEREHRVITSGPYHYVRHPGYVGMGLTQLATPVVLGTLWAFVPCLLGILMLVLRTALEDRMLRENLPGYTAYAQQTRYRLLPGVW